MPSLRAGRESADAAAPIRLSGSAIELAGSPGGYAENMQRSYEGYRQLSSMKRTRGGGGGSIPRGAIMLAGVVIRSRM